MKQIALPCSLMILVFLQFSCGQNKKAVFDNIKNNPANTWFIEHSNQSIDSIVTFRTGTITSTGMPIYTITTNSEKRKTDSTNEILKEASKKGLYPNPFSPETISLPYTLEQKSLLTITVYDTSGNEFTKLINNEMPEGEYMISFSIYSTLKPDVYFLEVKTPFQDQIRKLVIK